MPNTEAADGLRRSIVKRLPQGSAERIASLLDRPVAYVYDQHIAANGSIWTVDEADANPIEHPNCKRTFRPATDKLARPFGLYVAHDPSVSLEDSVG